MAKTVKPKKPVVKTKDTGSDAPPKPPTTPDPKK